jgi:hypothetical protein
VPLLVAVTVVAFVSATCAWQLLWSIELARFIKIPLSTTTAFPVVTEVIVAVPLAEPLLMVMDTCCIDWIIVVAVVDGFIAPNAAGSANIMPPYHRQAHR